MEESKTFKRLGIFALVPIQIFQDKNLTPTDRDVYAAISSFQGSNDICTPSIKLIAERSGKPRGSVFLSLNNLENLGWIKRIRRGQNQSNIYCCYCPENIDKPEKTTNSTTKNLKQFNPQSYPQ